MLNKCTNIALQRKAIFWNVAKGQQFTNSVHLDSSLYMDFGRSTKTQNNNFVFMLRCAVFKGEELWVSQRDVVKNDCSEITVAKDEWEVNK